MPPANTGREIISKITVTITDHTNSGSRSKVTPAPRMLMAVERKLTDPKIEETPDKWREKMAKSTLPPAWETILDSGG